MCLINCLSCRVSRQGDEGRAYIELEKIYSELIVEIKIMEAIHEQIDHVYCKCLMLLIDT